MRLAYTPVSEKDWISIIHGQQGGGFLGYPYQHGAGLGSIFRKIFRAIMPYAKTAGKSIGKSLLSTGADIASDVVSGENLKKSVNKNARKAASKLLANAAKKMEGGKLRRGINRRKKKNKGTRKKTQLGMII